MPRTLPGCFALLCLFVSSLVCSSVLAAPRIAVVGIHAPEDQRARASQLVIQLRDAFRESKRFNTLTESAMLQTVTDRRAALRDATFQARELRQEARVYAEEAQFGKAVETLDQAETQVLYFREHLTSLDPWADILISRAQLNVGLGNTERAEKDLRTLATISPTGQLDPLRFPPDTLERFRVIQTEVQASVADIDLSDMPSGAKVFLDGAPRGTTPTILRRVPNGFHFLRIEEPGVGVFFQDLNLTTTGTVPVSGRLAPPKFHAAPPRGAEETALESRLPVQIYRTLGRTLGADYVPLARLEGTALEVQLLHVSTGQVSPIFEAELGSQAANPVRALRNLLTQIEPLVGDDGLLTRRSPTPMSVDLNRNPQLVWFYFPPSLASLAMPDLPASTRTSSKPVYKRAWFWAVVGGTLAASAGGTTAAYLLTRDSGPSALDIQFNLP